MKIFFLANIALTLSLSLAFADNTTSNSSADWKPLYSAHSYKQMPNRLLRPVDFTSPSKYPVIISLHGSGGKGDNISAPFIPGNSDTSTSLNAQSVTRHRAKPDDVVLQTKA